MFVLVIKSNATRSSDYLPSSFWLLSEQLSISEVGLQSLCPGKKSFSKKSKFKILRENSYRGSHREQKWVFESASSNIENDFVFFRQIYLVIVVLGVTSWSLQVFSCPTVSSLTPQKTLKRLRRHFMFVSRTATTLKSAPRTSRQTTRDGTVQLPGTSRCPWSWGLDDDPNRFPRFLTKAVCPNCTSSCREVRYSLKGLVQDCDVRTGERVWMWTVVELTTAFVYDPWTFLLLRMMSPWMKKSRGPVRAL